jgi:hypothetical protein
VTAANSTFGFYFGSPSTNAKATTTTNASSPRTVTAANSTFGFYFGSPSTNAKNIALNKTNNIVSHTGTTQRTSTNEGQISTVKLGAAALTPQSNEYVVNLHDNTLSIISGQTKTVVGYHTGLSKYPAILTFISPFNRNTYVVNLHDNTLSIISGQTKTVVGNAIFLSNAAGKTTFVLASTKLYNVATAHKVALSSATSTKAVLGYSFTSTPIKHLVIIFQENVSFDHYFATYPYAKNLPNDLLFSLLHILRL